MKKEKQFKMFKTIRDVKKYVKHNYIDNGEIKEKPFWKNNPLSLEMRNIAKKIKLKTDNITLIHSRGSKSKKANKRENQLI